jgi:hypothetical protein
MALANIAALMSSWGKKVLIVDFDLEAPGIERFFETGTELSKLRRSKAGMLDLLTGVSEGSPLDWRAGLLEARPFAASPPVSIMTAGMTTQVYGHALQQLKWGYLFEERGLGGYLESLREDWRRSFDFTLIDSRTGISDIGGICTILLPDVLVTLFTTNKQSIDGVGEVVRRAKAAQERLPVDRPKLLAVPILGREEQSEYQLTTEWKERIANELGELYKDWLPKGTTAQDVLMKLYVPYVAYWSFGERLPVSERQSELSDPRSISSAYARIARLLQRGLDWKSMESEAEEMARQRRLNEADREARIRARRRWREQILTWVGLAGAAIGLVFAVAGIVKAARHVNWGSLSLYTETLRSVAIYVGGGLGGAYSWTIEAQKRNMKRRFRGDTFAERALAYFRTMLEPTAIGVVCVAFVAKYLGAATVLEQAGIGFFLGAAASYFVRNLVLARRPSKD